MRYVKTQACVLVLVLGSALPAAAQTVADSGTFVVRHSGDTVATETFSRQETTIRGKLSLNNSKHTFHRYTAVLAPDASVPMIDVSVREDADSGRVKAKLVQRARVIFKEDSAAVDAIIGQSIETRVFGTQTGAIPYLNMSFALLEQAIRRSRAAGATPGQIPFFNLGGGQTVSGTLKPVGADSMALAIGDVEFRLRVDPQGRVLGGAIPKQDVVVDRR
ncbi:MAG TPA: hypothetical protein VM094_08410 [Gemmatimonadales bacterium]|nr:hypothetical protein [Gemmatimonadales bacterium]